MHELNFSVRSIKWIMVCVTIVSYRYSFNGQVTELLKGKRGLRKGDPIPPMLFVLNMEYLHSFQKSLCNVADFNYHPRCEKMQIVNICFVDDLMLFAIGDGVFVQIMMHVFLHFLNATGLKAHSSKCKVYFRGTKTGVK